MSTMTVIDADARKLAGLAVQNRSVKAVIEGVVEESRRGIDTSEVFKGLKRALGGTPHEHMIGIMAAYPDQEFRSLVLRASRQYARDHGIIVPKGSR